jgi:lipid-A-disaccharide synthase
VDYVGNPVLDAIKAFQPNNQFLDTYSVVPDRKIVALLPGSRKIELKRIVPLMVEIVVRNPQVQFAVAVVSNLPEALYKPLANKPNVIFVREATYDLLTHAHAAIVTSGTATLETGIFKIPQVVVYKTSLVEYLIAKWLVKVEFISLVNLIANKEVIRELIQNNAKTEIVNAELNRLLNDEMYVTTMKGGLQPGVSNSGYRLCIRKYSNLNTEVFERKRLGYLQFTVMRLVEFFFRVSAIDY